MAWELFWGDGETALGSMRVSSSLLVCEPPTEPPRQAKPTAASHPHDGSRRDRVRETRVWLGGRLVQPFGFKMLDRNARGGTRVAPGCGTPHPISRPAWINAHTDMHSSSCRTPPQSRNRPHLCRLRRSPRRHIKFALSENNLKQAAFGHIAHRLQHPDP